MQIRTRMCTSLDGYISNWMACPCSSPTPSSTKAYGFVELQRQCDGRGWKW